MEHLIYDTDDNEKIVINFENAMFSEWFRLVDQFDRSHFYKNDTYEDLENFLDNMPATFLVCKAEKITKETLAQYPELFI